MVRRTFPHALLAALALAIVGAAGCGARSGSASVEYSVSAQQNYDKGLKQLENDDWLAAAKYFSFIRSRFPYSKYAVLAELRLADAEFGAEHYLEAIDAYKLFMKLHPTHEMVVNGYGNFRIGEAFVKMLPSDWWILPPSYEKDQTAPLEAEQQLRAFLKKFPESPFLPRAKKMLAIVSKRLAEHEWYVARFYWDRDRPMGTVLRLRRLLDRYAGVGFDIEAAWLFGQAYARVGMQDRARTTWQQLIDQHPKSERARQARDALGSLPASAPAPVTAPRAPG